MKNKRQEAGTRAMRTLMALWVCLLVVGCPEKSGKNIVGTYDLKDSKSKDRLALLGNGMSKLYANGKQLSDRKWEIVGKEVHVFRARDVHVLILNINSDGSLTKTGVIFFRERSDLPKDKHGIYEKIKGGDSAVKKWGDLNIKLDDYYKWLFEFLAGNALLVLTLWIYGKSPFAESIKAGVLILLKFWLMWLAIGVIALSFIMFLGPPGLIISFFISLVGFFIAMRVCFDCGFWDTIILGVIEFCVIIGISKMAG